MFRVIFLIFRRNFRLQVPNTRFDRINDHARDKRCARCFKDLAWKVVMPDVVKRARRREEKSYTVSLAVTAWRWSLTARRRCHLRDCKAPRTRESERKLDAREERERCIPWVVRMESH